MPLQRHRAQCQVIAHLAQSNYARDRCEFNPTKRGLRRVVRYIAYGRSPRSGGLQCHTCDTVAKASGSSWESGSLNARMAATIALSEANRVRS